MVNKDDRGKRIEYLDTARGILIILVVIGHTLLFSGGFDVVPYSYLMKAIYSFHMMAFFLISGFLFNKEKWCETSIVSFSKNRAFRLIVPYFFFEIVGAIIHALFDWGNKESVLTIVANILSQNVYVGADWYLPTLFCGEIILFLCCKYLNRIANIIIAIVGIIVVSLGQDYISGQILFITKRIILCASILLIGYHARSIFLAKKASWCTAGVSVVWLVCSQLNRTIFYTLRLLEMCFCFYWLAYVGHILS